MHLLHFAGLFIAATTVSAGFVHPPGSTDGIYVHTIDAHGNPVNTFIGPSSHLKDAPHLIKALKERQTGPAPSKIKMKARYAGPTGNEGVNCDSGVQGDPQDLVDAEFILGFACDSLQWWYHAISSVSLGAVAYACDYGNGNHCDDETMANYQSDIDSACSNNTAGWYSIHNYLYATGRTNVGEQFCW